MVGAGVEIGSGPGVKQGSEAEAGVVTGKVVGACAEVGANIWEEQNRSRRRAIISSTSRIRLLIMKKKMEERKHATKIILFCTN